MFAGTWLPEQPPADGLYDGDLVVRPTLPADPTCPPHRDHLTDIELLLASQGRRQYVGDWRELDDRWPRVVAPAAAAVMGLRVDATEATARSAATPPSTPPPPIKWARGGIADLLDAGLINVDDELVWDRRNTGVRHTARVRVDGSLVLADGRVCTNSGGATKALGGKYANGWTVFRRASDGRTLDDLRTELRTRHGK